MLMEGEGNKIQVHKSEENGMMVIRKRILALGLIVLLGGLLGAVTAAGNENLPVRNLEFINVDLRQVFRSLAATGQFNVILGQTVKGNVSIAFKSGITAREAVAVIAKNYGHQCQWSPDSKGVCVGDIKSLTGGLTEKTLVEIPLKYIDATAAASSLEIIIPKERIKPDSSGRKLIVFGNSLELQNINELIAKIDRSQAEVNVEVKIAEVTDDFWRKLGMDRKVVRSHIGIYPISAFQEKELSDLDIIRSLGRRNLALFDNQEGKLFLGDRFQKIIEKNNSQTGPGLPAKEFIDLGTMMRITSWVGEGNKITLQVKETTWAAKLSPTAALNNKAVFLPDFASRDVTSTISMEAGQTFILTGMIGRDEFELLKTFPGANVQRNCPVLNELFATENSQAAFQKNNTQVIAMITPNFLGNNSSQDILQNSGQQTSVAPDVNPDQTSDGNFGDSKNEVAGVNGNPANDADKTEVVWDAANTSSKPVQQNDVNDPVVIVEYLVKKNDTLTAISAKFSIESQAIITANQWDNQNVIIKADSWVLIPVPKDRVYLIKPKETLWRIAKRYGTTVELLKDLNNIMDIEKVKAGQKIVLPVANSQIKEPQF
jgi:LysM repeat protein